MNNIINSIQLLGNLGHDTELKTVAGGKKLAKVTLATNSVYTKDGEKKEETQWHNIVGWGNLADKMHTYFKKGKRVMVKGKLKYNSYQTDGGEMKYYTQIEVREFVLLS